jgi:hypothetical protein
MHDKAELARNVLANSDYSAGSSTMSPDSFCPYCDSNNVKLQNERYWFFFLKIMNVCLDCGKKWNYSEVWKNRDISDLSEY